MTTDTKAVARWDVETMDERTSSEGRWVLFTDHKRIIEEIGLLWARELVKRDHALAASRAEVESLEHGIIRALEEIEDNGPKALKYAAQELRAAMEIVNV